MLLTSSLLSASYRSFLFSKEGNPNKRNVHNETCLHVLCQGPQILLLSEGALSPRLARPQRDEQRRAECLQVQAHGGRTSSSEYAESWRVLLYLWLSVTRWCWAGRAPDWREASMRRPMSTPPTITAAPACTMLLPRAWRYAWRWGKACGAVSSAIGMSRFWRLVSWLSQPCFFQQNLPDNIRPVLAPTVSVLCLRTVTSKRPVLLCLCSLCKENRLSELKGNEAKYCFLVLFVYNLACRARFRFSPHIPWVHLFPAFPSSCWFRAKQTFSSRMRKS